MQKDTYQLISELMNDPILERRTCPISKTEFPIYQSDHNLLQKLSPTIANKQYILPYPTKSPEERARQRYTWRNIHKFFKSTCALSGKDIISLYPRDSSYTVYHQDIRFSDQRNPLDYSREISFSQPFFIQFDALLKAVPRMALVNTNSTNCHYANYIKDGKNCYMTSVTYYDCENLAYCVWIMDGKDSVDCLQCRHIQYCIQCTDSNHIFRCAYLHESNNCTDVYFSTNLNNCDHCFLCTNLSNKSYHIQNQSYTKEQYHEKIQQIKSDPHRYQNCIKSFEQILQDRTVKATSNKNCQKCIGNQINNSENARFVFGADNIQDGAYIVGENLKDCMDMTGWTVELWYLSTNIWLDGSSHIIGSVSILNSHHMYYCDNCYDNCSYCFGCIGLRNKSYCIFNKQYTKQERETLVDKIINHMITTGEWWEFFPISMSPFAYNNSRAQQRFPSTKKEAETKWYPRYDHDHSPYPWPWYIPKSINQYDTSVVWETQADKNKQELLGNIVKCKKSQRWMRIISIELDIYTKLWIPLPEIHPDLRYENRYARLAPKTLNLHTCAQSHKTILSVYPPTKSNVISEEIYNQKIYG